MKPSRFGTWRVLEGDSLAAGIQKWEAVVRGRDSKTGSGREKVGTLPCRRQEQQRE